MNGEDVDQTILGSVVEDPAPLANSPPPEAFRALQAFDVAVGEAVDRGADAFAVFAAELAKGLQGSGADSIRQPPGLASVQLRLGIGPRQGRFASRIFDRAKIVVGQLLVIQGGGVELRHDGVLGTAKQNRCRWQRFVGKSVDKLVELGLGSSASKR